MILTGRHYNAREALDLGLINRIFPEEQFESGLTSLLEQLLSKSGAVMRIALKGLRELSLRDFSSALSRSEEIYCRELLNTEDVEEGVRAFLEKRKPNWQHR
jgi:enoyl-CoA hydratase/carnithine racemase